MKRILTDFLFLSVYIRVIRVACAEFNRSNPCPIYVAEQLPDSNSELTFSGLRFCYSNVSEDSS